jgi:hypothetical protein
MNPRRYTRKISRETRRNPDKELAIDLHNFLNRIDVEKDAVHAAVPIRDRTLFHARADELFGPLLAQSYSKSVAQMRDIVGTYRSEKATVCKIKDYATNRHLVTRIVPPTVRIGIQDAGLCPTTFNSAIQILVTPGSYIDRCDRAKGTMLYGFKRPLRERDFKQLGMSSHVREFVPTLGADMSCRVVIHRPGSTIDALFDDSYKPIAGDVAYFEGNTVKNTWFNDADASASAAASATAHTYILVKELGDTLQAYYTRLFIDETGTDRRTVCMFTNDELLAMRCQLLFVPVLYSVNADKTDKLFYMYPVMDEIRADFIAMYRSNLEVENARVIEHIESVLSKQYCLYPNGRIVRFTSESPFAAVLRDCIKEIQKNTALFSTYPVDAYDVEQVRRLSNYFRAVQIFNEKGVVNTGARALFVLPKRDTPVFRDPWGAVVDRLIAQTGGGGSSGSGSGSAVEIVPPPYSAAEYMTATGEVAQLSYIKTCNALFDQMHLDYPEKSTAEVHAHVENIHSLFCCYFGYVAESTSFKGFIVRFVDMYMRGVLWMSYEEFEQMFESWKDEYDRIHPPLPTVFSPPPVPSMETVIADLKASVATSAAWEALSAPMASSVFTAPSIPSPPPLPLPPPPVLMFAYGGRRTLRRRRRGGGGGDL